MPDAAGGAGPFPHVKRLGSVQVPAGGAHLGDGRQSADLDQGAPVPLRFVAEQGQAANWDQPASCTLPASPLRASPDAARPPREPLILRDQLRGRCDRGGRRRRAPPESEPLDGSVTTVRTRDVGLPVWAGTSAQATYVDVEWSEDEDDSWGCCSSAEARARFFGVRRSADVENVPPAPSQGHQRSPPAARGRRRRQHGDSADGQRRHRRRGHGCRHRVLRGTRYGAGGQGGGRGTLRRPVHRTRRRPL